jgi:hypothetical protein
MKSNGPEPVKPRDYLKWLAVDLDGTLAKGIWTPDNPTSAIGHPIWGNITKLTGLASEGWKVVIHTSRPWHDYEAIEAWLDHWDVPWKAIVCGKLLAAAYIDDRGINALDENWLPRSADAQPR